jgi:hypothetical protein
LIDELWRTLHLKDHPTTIAQIHLTQLIQIDVDQIGVDKE